MTSKLAAVATAMWIGLAAPGAASTDLGALEFDFVITGFVHDGGTGLDAILDLPTMPAPPPDIRREEGHPIKMGRWDKVVFNFRPPAGKALAVNVEANRGAFRLGAPLDFSIDVETLQNGEFSETVAGAGYRSDKPISLTFEARSALPRTYAVPGVTSFERTEQRVYPEGSLINTGGQTFGWERIILGTAGAGFDRDEVLTNIRIEVTPPPPSSLIATFGRPWDFHPDKTILSTVSLDGSTGPMTLSLVNAPTPIPLPGAGPLALVGLAALAALARRRRATA